MTAPAVRLSGLTKFYGRDRGIEDVSLDVARGEVFGLLGPNGAGKTTAIRLLLDLIRPTAGRALVLGFDANREGLEVRRRVGYLPGELRLPGRSTGRHFLGFLDRLRSDRDANGIEALADRFGLALDRRIEDLSKGNRQKIGLVAALMGDAPVLLLDEPTSGLDPLRQQDVQELMRERARGGATVLLSSHALDQVEHAADRVGIVNDGRLVAVESVRELKRRAVKRVRVQLARPVPQNGLARLPGVRHLECSGKELRFEVEGSMDALIKELAQLPVDSVISEEPELDEIFLAYYGREHAR
jgi:ABC-2 type transport system ATP-binding protein